MTSITTNPFLNVGGVIELNVVGQHMHAHPFNRSIFFVSFTDFSNKRRIGFDLNMTIHTSAKSRNIGVLRTLHLIMTILTLYLILSCMQRMVKRNGLFRLIVF